MSWIVTHSGVKAYPLDLGPETVNIEDIAHSLALQCRFRGHCKRFYSVAQHSLLVARHVPQELALPALLHDAAEAYLGDCVVPLKPVTSLAGIPFKEAEHVALCRILNVLDVRWPDDWAPIKAADRRACVTEARDLFDNPRLLEWDPVYAVPPFEDPTYPWEPEPTEFLFLTFYRLLKNRETAP